MCESEKRESVCHRLVILDASLTFVVSSFVDFSFLRTTQEGNTEKVSVSQVPFLQNNV